MQIKASAAACQTLIVTSRSSLRVKAEREWRMQRGSWTVGGLQVQRGPGPPPGQRSAAPCIVLNTQHTYYQVQSQQEQLHLNTQLLLTGQETVKQTLNDLQLKPDHQWDGRLFLCLQIQTYSRRKSHEIKTILRQSAEGEFRKEAVLFLHLLCEGGCKNKQETKVPGQSFNRLLYETWEN